MAYDEGLAERIREVVDEDRAITEKKMFGGLAFMSAGHMFIGIVGDQLMVRCGPDRYEESLKKAHVSPMNFTGKPMKGYVYVAPAGIREDKKLGYWIALSLSFVKTLEPKAAKAPRGPKK